jgi:hypothetical protein
MEDMNRLILQVLPGQDSDAEELADLGDQLREELLEFDLSSVAPLPADEVPPGARGIGQVAGWLVAQFGTLDALRAVIYGVRAWAARTQRTVEITMDGDTLKLEAGDRATTAGNRRCLARPAQYPRLTWRRGRRPAE